MCWEVIAACSASAGIIFSVVYFVIIPFALRRRRSKPLARIIELKDEAIKIQNDNNKTLSDAELTTFKQEVDALKAELLAEIGKISKLRARQYENWGEVDTYLFRRISNREQLVYLGIINSCWKLADRIIEKYS